AAPDLPLLGAAANTGAYVRRTGERIIVRGEQPFGLSWTGPALVDGSLWPVAGHDTVWLPPGEHSVEPAPSPPPARVLRFNGELAGASVDGSTIRLTYESSTR